MKLAAKTELARSNIVPPHELLEIFQGSVGLPLVFVERRGNLGEDAAGNDNASTYCRYSGMFALTASPDHQYDQIPAEALEDGLSVRGGYLGFVATNDFPPSRRHGLLRRTTQPDSPVLPFKHSLLRVGEPGATESSHGKSAIFRTYQQDMLIGHEIPRWLDSSFATDAVRHSIMMAFVEHLANITDLDKEAVASLHTPHYAELALDEAHQLEAVGENIWNMRRPLAAPEAELNPFIRSLEELIVTPGLLHLVIKRRQVALDLMIKQ
jgi:hypothetical protein